MPRKKGYRLVWSDEFNKDGIPDSTKWNYEKDLYPRMGVEYVRLWERE
ncbi:hypothetical protein [Agriterribacter sp.]|nr:hypothetical protein [Agriterribacter sp.]HTN07060.1 hypothetical protein [Agriterribacter sp.]